MAQYTRAGQSSVFLCGTVQYSTVQTLGYRDSSTLVFCVLPCSVLCSDQLERGATHDELWDAAQMEMVHRHLVTGAKASSNTLVSRVLSCSAGISWSGVRPTTSCGTLRRWRWCTVARCMASCACTGPRRSWSGPAGDALSRLLNYTVVTCDTAPTTACGANGLVHSEGQSDSGVDSRWVGAKTAGNSQPLTFNPSDEDLTCLASKMHGFMRMYWAQKILEWTSR
mgnify:CR=1 FL=1